MSDDLRARAIDRLEVDPDGWCWYDDHPHEAKRDLCALLAPITPERFEAARQAYVDAWLAADRDNTVHVPGTRTASGLRAALKSLGIEVSDG